MKRIFLFYISLVTSVVVFSKTINHPQCLLNQTNCLIIEKVVLDDESTTIFLETNVKPYTGIRIGEATILSDDNQQEYKLLSAEGLTIGEMCYVPKHGALRFSLSFEPLPQGTKVFDLIENVSNGFRVLGICVNRNKFVFPQANSCADKCEIDERYFKGGKACIKGRIKGYSRESNVDVVSLDYSHSVSTDIYTNRCYRINQQGDFLIDVNIECPTWRNFQLGAQQVPFYLRPGDTLHVVVDDYLSECPRVHYQSSHINGCAENLLKIAQPIDFSPFWQNKARACAYPDELVDSFNECLKQLKQMVNYVSWKYHFTSWETHLLWINELCAVESSYLSRATRILKNSKQPCPNGLEEEYYHGNDYSIYQILNVLPLDDATVSIVPNGRQLAETMSRISIFTDAYNGTSRNGYSLKELQLHAKNNAYNALKDYLGVKGNPWLLQQVLVQRDRYNISSEVLKNKESVDQQCVTIPYFKQKLNYLISNQNIPLTQTKYIENSQVNDLLQRIVTPYIGKFVNVHFITPSKDSQRYVHKYLTCFEDLNERDDIVPLFLIEDNSSMMTTDFMQNVVLSGFKSIVLDRETFISLREEFAFSGKHSTITLNKNGERLYNSPMFHGSPENERLSLRYIMRE